MSQFALSQINLIVALGNVGERYARTRHNAGFLWADAYVSARRGEWRLDQGLKAFRCDLPDVVVLKPNTLMNNSGDSARLALDGLKVWPQHCLVVHDDLDIALGEYKLQFRRGPHIHNGITSVEKRLGTDKFWRLRLGIDARAIKGNRGVPGLTYSLAEFTSVELARLNEVISQSLSEHFIMPHA